MKTRNGLRLLGVAAALFAVTLIASGARPAAQDQTTANRASAGGYLFKTYCASCHGESARGDGPLASSMRRRPPNLTEISKRAKGAYPRDMVFQIIDGRTKVPGHGGPDMPVWGDAFLRTADADESTVQRRIRSLVDYLEVIQQNEN